IFQESVRVHGSSRTDTGVHARGMIAHFDLPEEKIKMPLSKVPLALNSQLPGDIRIMEARRVPDSFHARFSAQGKEYRYFVYNYHAMDPLLRNKAWHVPQALNLAAMRFGSKYFIGKQDFAAFANNRNYEMESTVRAVRRCEVRKTGRLIAFIIQGDGFLYKMCRGIVGTLVQVGQGRFVPHDIERMLKAQDRRMAGMTAPAQGLVLWRVLYQR
ncbi:MAG TPA: tRNA pseudouridine(38-40) synthase TruA, partial [Verrucomicrobiae bacterium]|nr:tRNA pseudouridine(38-40) synthase TruA [Verrucomicrobiae bacterium]